MNAHPTHHLPPAWRRPLPVLLGLLAIVLLAYRDTAAAMVAIWSRSDTFAHAYLVLPIVLWLIWRQRHALAALQPEPCAWVALPMAGVALAWLLGDLTGVNSITQFAMTALLLLAVPAVLGLQVTRAVLFPLAFVFFAVPIGEFLLPQLMSWTADFTVLALQASGIPVFREGMQIVVPTGTWSVVEACSGVRYLIASLMVGTLFAYLHYRSTRRRWMFVGIAIVVPIVANWVRAYLIVLIGHLSGNKLAIGVDHLIYGWLFFGVVIGLMFLVGGWWSDPDAQVGARPAPAVAPPWRRRDPRVVATAVAALALMLAPKLALHVLGDATSAAPPELAGLSGLTGGWQPSVHASPAWRPAFQNPSAEANSAYTADGREVGVYVGYYRRQDYEHKLVSSLNSLVESNDHVWVATNGPGIELSGADGRAFKVRSAALKGRANAGDPEQRLAVWQVYWVGDHLTASDAWAKVYAALGRLAGRGDDAAVIILYADEEQGGGADAALESFARANLGAIVEQLRKTRDGTQASVAANQSSMRSRSANE